MKKINSILRLVVLSSILSFVSTWQVFASDTLVVDGGEDLFEVINGLTGDDGLLSHHVLLLKQNAVYFNSEISTINDDFSLIGEEGEGVPPYIIPRRTGNGEYVRTWFLLEGIGKSFTAKNIIFQMLPPDGFDLGLSVSYIFQAKSDNQRLIMDNCVVNHSRNETFTSDGNGQYIKITNCNFRNSGYPDLDWAGGVVTPSIKHSGWKDSLIFTNNTVSNAGGYGFLGHWGEVCKAVIIDHNTFFGIARAAIFAGFQGNVHITNNMLVASESSGTPKSRNTKLRSSFEMFGETCPAETFVSTWQIWTIRGDALEAYHDVLGYEGDIEEVEKQRVFEIKNNCVWWPKQLVTAWDTIDEDGGAQDKIVLFSETDSFLLAHQTNSVYEGNYGNTDTEDAKISDFDPGFKQEWVDKIMTVQIEWLNGFRKDPNFVPYFRNFDEPENRVQLEWPLPEDFSYTNETLLTGGTDGLPVGDLNWFKNGTSIKNASSVLNSIEVNNYPNPFQEITTIQFKLKKSSTVKITILDVTGKEVAVLLNEYRIAGTHSINWNCSSISSSLIPGGIYLSKIETNDGFNVRKMIKLN